jgi:hypothetical protein
MPTIIFIVVLRWVEGLSLLTHLKLTTRLPDNHVSLNRQLTLNALQFCAWLAAMGPRVGAILLFCFQAAKAATPLSNRSLNVEP